jgi:hypothetical protein
MGTKIYTVDIDIKLRPIGTPRCRIAVADQRLDLVIDKEQWVKINCQGRGDIKLSIEHYGKADLDPNTALVIEQINFNEISSPKFVWEGLYYPTYPTHMSGDSELKYHNYLGWNGVWTLDFTLPIYTWIHKVEDLGWIYD